MCRKKITTFEVFSWKKSPNTTCSPLTLVKRALRRAEALLSITSSTSVGISQGVAVVASSMVLLDHSDEPVAAPVRLLDGAIGVRFGWKAKEWPAKPTDATKADAMVGEILISMFVSFFLLFCAVLVVLSSRLAEP